MVCTSFRWVVRTFWTHVSWRRIGSWRFGLFCPSLHWSQILRFVTNAGSGSRILRLPRKIPLLFGEKSFETVCFTFVSSPSIGTGISPITLLGPFATRANRALRTSTVAETFSRHQKLGGSRDPRQGAHLSSKNR